MKLKIYDSKGAATAQSVTLADEVFGIEPNNHAIYLDVKQHLANKRQGTHKSKERNEIAGSTKKLKRQKGTGGARAGSAKSGTRVGGGRIFGPRPRDYHFKLNKKVKSLARQSALAAKAQSGDIAILDSVSFATPQTKAYLAMLKALQLDNTKTLLITPEVDKNVVLSGRNVPKTKVTTAGDVNTYDLVNAGKLLITTAAIEKIESSFSN
jgi:large subunit ribosomal protein L4